MLRPSSKLVRLVMSLHTVRITETYVSARSAYWTDRIAAGAGREATSELRFERQSRDVVRQLATNFVDWRSRLALIAETQAFTLRTGRETRSPAVVREIDNDEERGEATAGSSSGLWARIEAVFRAVDAGVA